MSTPATWGWKRRLADGLGRVGLLRPAVAVYEGALTARWSLRRSHGAGAAGGDLPIPPARLRVRAGPAHADVDYFLRSGERHAALIRQVLAEHGTPLDECSALLDFGCGCGRVVRRWRDLAGTDIVGCDINPKMIAWCTQNLPYGTFLVTELDPPLPFDRDRFDVVYAFSVFTHLPEALQFAWIAEFGRVIRPGGLLVISTLGEHYAGLGRLTGPELEAFHQGELVVLYEGDPGSNLCSAYHPVSYVRDTLAVGFEHVALLPTADDASHDLHVLRRV